jgi:hypothetical protein
MKAGGASSTAFGELVEQKKAEDSTISYRVS